MHSAITPPPPFHSSLLASHPMWNTLNPSSSRGGKKITPHQYRTEGRLYFKIQFTEAEWGENVSAGFCWPDKRVAALLVEWGHALMGRGRGCGIWPRPVCDPQRYCLKDFSYFISTLLPQVLCCLWYELRRLYIYIYINTYIPPHAISKSVWLFFLFSFSI